MKNLDPFYTRPDLARAFALAMADRWPDPNVLFVEPSAGAGAFSRPLLDAGRKVRAMDIQPGAPHIRRGDFLARHQLFSGHNSATVVIGNPPFGRNAALAVRFFNRAADHADAIAFVVPRTFRKMSLQNQLQRNFHLTLDEDMPRHAFVLDGRPHDVPCAWQVWTRKPDLRPVPTVPSVAHLIEYTDPARARFAMRRVGFYAGRVVRQNIMELSRSTHYFMRDLQAGVIDILEKTDWVNIAAQTAGVRSLSKREIAVHLATAFDA